jgi:hypothetical protein
MVDEHIAVLMAPTSTWEVPVEEIQQAHSEREDAARAFIAPLLKERRAERRDLAEFSERSGFPEEQLRSFAMRPLSVSKAVRDKIVGFLKFAHPSAGGAKQNPIFRVPLLFAHRMRLPPEADFFIHECVLWEQPGLAEVDPSAHIHADAVPGALTVRGGDYGSVVTLSGILLCPWDGHATLQHEAYELGEKLVKARRRAGLPLVLAGQRTRSKGIPKLWGAS